MILTTKKRALLAFAFAVAAIALIAFPQEQRSNPAPLTADGHGRFTIPVMVNGQGPFAFLVDTGAAMSCVSEPLVDKLQLWRIPHVEVDVQGTTGSEKGRMYLLKSYSSALFDRKIEPVVMLPSVAATQADGVIGVNAFLKKRIEFDFVSSSFAVRPSGSRAAQYVVVPARMLPGSKLVVDVVLDGVHARAIVDTGNRRTTGNLELARALGLNPGDARLLSTTPISGATHDKLPASQAELHLLTMGAMEFAKPTIVFSDIASLKAPHIEGPALQLGMDVLGKLKGLAIDYPRSELQLRP